MEPQGHTQTILLLTVAPKATECENFKEKQLPHPLRKQKFLLPLQPLSPLTPESENVTQKDSFHRRQRGLAIKNLSFTPTLRPKVWLGVHAPFSP